MSRCSKVSGNLESSCKKLTFYYHIIEINFYLHEIWTYSKVISIIYKEMIKDRNHLGFLSAM